MLGTRKFRFGERMAARDADQSKQGPVLTSEDEANLEAFSKTLQDAVHLLQEEIAAIKDGRLNVVSDLYERKNQILKWLELKMPVIEPFLSHDGAKNHKLQGSIEELQKVATEDSELLSRMSVAARSIVREIEKSNDRNSLTGNYGKSGQKLGASSGGELRIDREF